MIKICLALLTTISTVLAQPTNDGYVSVLLTRGDRSKLLSEQPRLQWQPVGKSQANIFINASVQYQQMEGVGAALTDSSAYLMSQKLGGTDRSALINDLFGSIGANLNYIRIPLSSSDMSTEDFTHDDMEYP